MEPPDLIRRSVLASELEDVRTFAAPFFEDGFAEAERLKTWHEYVGTCCWKTVYPEQPNRLQGAFSVLPLSREGREAIQLESVLGADLKLRHLAASRRKTAGWYGGFVVARFRARPSTARWFLHTLKEKTRQCPAPVYGRTVTPEGRLLAKRAGFEPILGTENIVGAFPDEIKPL